jgi:hypothetical protein
MLPISPVARPKSEEEKIFSGAKKNDAFRLGQTPLAFSPATGYNLWRQGGPRTASSGVMDHGGAGQAGSAAASKAVAGETTAAESGWGQGCGTTIDYGERGW